MLCLRLAFLTHPPLPLYACCIVGNIRYIISGVYDTLCFSVLYATPDIIHIGVTDVSN